MFLLSLCSRVTKAKCAAIRLKTAYPQGVVLMAFIIRGCAISRKYVGIRRRPALSRLDEMAPREFTACAAISVRVDHGLRIGVAGMLLVDGYFDIRLMNRR